MREQLYRRWIEQEYKFLTGELEDKKYSPAGMALLRDQLANLREAALRDGLRFNYNGKLSRLIED